MYMYIYIYIYIILVREIPYSQRPEVQFAKPREWLLAGVHTHINITTSVTVINVIIVIVIVIVVIIIIIIINNVIIITIIIDIIIIIIIIIIIMCINIAKRERALCRAFGSLCVLKMATQPPPSS